MEDFRGLSRKIEVLRRTRFVENGRTYWRCIRSGPGPVKELKARMARLEEMKRRRREEDTN